MTLESLIAEYRTLADDRLDPPWVTDTQLWDFFHEAESEAAIRGRLIHESDDPAVCQIAVVSGTAVYTLHPALYEITYLTLLDSASVHTKLKLVSSEKLDSEPWFIVNGNSYDPVPDQQQWRNETGTPTLAIQGDRTLRLVPIPDAAGTLYLEGYRLPLGAPGSDPEIHVAHQRHLIQWALYRAFSIPGSEQQDAKKAEQALGEFTRYFGPRPGSDLRRDTRCDTPHQVAAHFV
jgi:hypothetical protein